MVSLEVQVLQPTAIVSILMSGCVLITVLVFPGMVHRRIFMQLIVSISVADILGNWTYCLSQNPARGTFLCAFEGFANLFFFPVGWILTMFLTLLFRDLLLNGAIYYSRTFIFGVSIMVPLTITLLYLTFTSFTTDDDHETHPCTFGQSGQLYHQITYDGMIGVCLIVMALMLFQVMKYELDNTQRAKQKTYQLVKKILTLYPVALIVCWAPHSLCILISECSDSMQAEVYTTFLKIIHGGLVALIFFSVSKEARLKWYNLLCCTKRPAFGMTGDNDHLVPSMLSEVLSEGSLPQDGDLQTLLNNSISNRDGDHNATVVNQGIFGADMDLNDEFSDEFATTHTMSSSNLPSRTNTNTDNSSSRPSITSSTVRSVTNSVNSTTFMMRK